MWKDWIPLNSNAVRLSWLTCSWIKIHFHYLVEILLYRKSIYNRSLFYTSRLKYNFVVYGFFQKWWQSLHNHQVQIAYWILKQRLITLRPQRKAVDTKVHVHKMHVCVCLCLCLYFHSEKKYCFRFGEKWYW